MTSSVGVDGVGASDGVGAAGWDGAGATVVGTPFDGVGKAAASDGGASGFWGSCAPGEASAGKTSFGV